MEIDAGQAPKIGNPLALGGEKHQGKTGETKYCVKTHVRIKTGRAEYRNSLKDEGAGSEKKIWRVVFSYSE